MTAERVLGTRTDTAAPRRARIERLLAEARDRPISVTTMREEPNRFSTLNDADVVFIELSTGERLSLFVKQIRRHGHPDKTKPDREAELYAKLFVSEDLPLPRFFGASYDAVSQRGELFLEFVPDWDLRYHGIELWEVAVRDLARLHGWFSERAPELVACGALLRLDAPYFGAWASRAVDAVGTRSAALGRLLERGLDDYGRVAALLERQPPTLVHNDLSPKNVVVDRSRRPVRTCILDWEVAGMGCGLLDLVHLAYGLGAHEHGRLQTIYVDELAHGSLIPDSLDERRVILRACEAHKTLHRLAHVAQWHTPITTIEQWVDDVRRMAASW